ncbi:MAG: bifunctional adenosylcobinamide kinase/adenosylcobinamide-phosphate guanylyltransferase [Lachnospiraceae bacterium]|nr:bifunctional adenosylcobinamide kinase/adenosylcobinamide-phosphate guanylyltransferase [Lachnospiraceae bacterium]
MRILIIGTPDSGKSLLAENICEEISKDLNKYYIATMIPFGEEGIKRVKKHRAMREGKGFVTIECSDNIHLIYEQIKPDSTVLLECLSNLVGNEMHHKNASLIDSELIEKIKKDVLGLTSKNLLIVSNEFEIKDSFDEDTKRYCKLLHMANESLRKEVDRVYEIINGEWKEIDNH